MANLLDNCSYNTIKLLHELSRLAWFIDHHAIKDAQDAGDTKCIEQLKAVSQELKRQVSALAEK